MRTEIILIFGKIGILGVKFSYFLGLDVGYCAKNGGRRVSLQGLGKIGKARTFENVRKTHKIVEKLRKFAKNDVKRSKIFENVRFFSS